MKRSTVLIASNESRAIPGFVSGLQRKEYELLGDTTIDVAVRTILGGISVDVLLIFTGANFQPALDATREVVTFRYENNYAPRPQILVVATTDRIAHVRSLFARAGARFIVARGLDALHDELQDLRRVIAEIAVSLPPFILVHSRTIDAPPNLCVPGEHSEAVQYVPLVSHPVDVIDVPASVAERTFMAAAMTMNGRFRSKREFHRDLAHNPLYAGRRDINVPSETTIKTYINQDNPEALQRAFDECRSGANAKAVIERQYRGNEVAYRFRVRWTIVHIKRNAA